MARMFFWDHSPSRLYKILEENKDKLKIDRNGRVSVNLQSEAALSAIIKQIKKLESISLDPSDDR